MRVPGWAPVNQTSSWRSMSGALARLGQAIDLQLATEGLQHAQHVFEADGGFAGLQLNNEAHPTPAANAS